jgi:hypothetical protein
LTVAKRNARMQKIAQKMCEETHKLKAALPAEVVIPPLRLGRLGCKAA